MSVIPDILKLRELHAEMDHVVLNTYGWNDIPIDCDFFLNLRDRRGRMGR